MKPELATKNSVRNKTAQSACKAAAFAVAAANLRFGAIAWL